MESQTSSIPPWVVSKDEYLSTISQHQQHFDNLESIVMQSGAFLEGNCFYENMKLNKRVELIPKQRNLFSIARGRNEILEIGFNAGHSTLLFLLANPLCKVTCFDLCTHSYVLPSFRYLEDHFPGQLRMFQGNSNHKVAEFHIYNPGKKFDVLHIDGGHGLNVAHTDFINCRNLTHSQSVVIWDDVDINQLKFLWGQYIACGFVKPFEMLSTPMYAHAFAEFSNMDRSIPHDARQLADRQYGQL